MIRVSMIYFAQAREAAGTKREEFKLHGQPRIGTAVLRAFEIHPELKRLEKSLRFALNEEITLENVELRDGDRVALLPPVVGG